MHQNNNLGLTAAIQFGGARPTDLSFRGAIAPLPPYSASPELIFTTWLMLIASELIRQSALSPACHVLELAPQSQRYYSNQLSFLHQFFKYVKNSKRSSQLSVNQRSHARFKQLFSSIIAGKILLLLLLKLLFISVRNNMEFTYTQRIKLKKLLVSTRTSESFGTKKLWKSAKINSHD